MSSGPEKLTFRISQILSEHGCFALLRIGAVNDKTCAECGTGIDTALHIVSECPAFVAQRKVLQKKMFLTNRKVKG